MMQPGRWHALVNTIFKHFIHHQGISLVQATDGIQAQHLAIVRPQNRLPVEFIISILLQPPSGKIGKYENLADFS